MSNKRYFILVLGCISMCLLSVIYTWTIIAVPIEAEFGFSKSLISSVFTVTMCLFGFGGIVGGLLSKWMGFKKRIAVAIVCALIGYPVSALGNDIFAFYLGYGLFGALGVGIGYNAIIGALGKWFPDKLGLCNGILLMGFGAGSSVLSPVAAKLIELYGWRYTMLTFGIFVVSALVIAFVGIRDLEDTGRAKKTAALSVANQMDISTSMMLKTTRFWLLLCWGTLLSAIGHAVVSNASSIAFEAGVERMSMVAAVTSVLALGNGCGRVLVGRLFDVIGYKKAMIVINLALPCSIAGLSFSVMTSNIFFFMVSCTLVGFFYGGVPVSQTVATRIFFGSKFYTSNVAVAGLYGMISSFIGPILAGYSYDIYNSYIPAMLILTVLGLCVMILLIFMNKEAVNNRRG